MTATFSAADDHVLMATTLGPIQLSRARAMDRLEDYQRRSDKLLRTGGAADRMYARNIRALWIELAEAAAIVWPDIPTSALWPARPVDGEPA